METARIAKTRQIRIQMTCSTQEIQWRGKARTPGLPPWPRNAEIKKENVRFSGDYAIPPPSFWKAVTKSVASAASPEGFGSCDQVGRAGSQLDRSFRNLTHFRTPVIARNIGKLEITGSEELSAG